MPLFESEQHARDFASSLNTKALGRQIEFHEQTQSTNDLALKAGREGAAHGKLFIAEAQNSGRGRRGRTWESPPGKGLLLSVLVRLSGNAPEFADIRSGDYGWIPLLSGLACAEAASSTALLEATIKWPNDVVLPASTSPGWRKLGGILCESVLTQPGEGGGSFVVIGIGLNINHTSEELPAFAKAPPTSLYLESGQLHDRLAVLRALLQTLEQRLDALAKPANSEIKDAVVKRLGRWWQNKTLCVEGPNGDNGQSKVMTGTYGGLDEFGRLKIIRGSGREYVLADAEILSVV
jgi:BirA family transcriptional regulator, biotin operon repressor / biotin---[acetyl-CoA-carboxylase] ligase